MVRGYCWWSLSLLWETVVSSKLIIQNNQIKAPLHLAEMGDFLKEYKLPPILTVGFLKYFHKLDSTCRYWLLYMNIVNINQNLIFSMKISKLLVDSIFTKFFIRGIVWLDKSRYISVWSSINLAQCKTFDTNFFWKLILLYCKCPDITSYIEAT